MVRGAVTAVLVGAAIAMQVRLLGRVTADAGPQVVGLLASSAGVAVALVAVVRDWAAVGRVVTRPDWGVAGALGVVAVAGLGAASARAGTVVTVAGSIAGQLVAGAVLDRV
ncbi:MAG TPA: DMT family transporter [Acidimicrobiales bacterium]|nr:DMT family transporter [Acidimicrobiales bacterium]